VAGDWQLPKVIRESLRAWQFDQATQLLAEARGLLGRRAELRQAAADNGMTLPAQLEAAFEGDAGFAAATAEADAEAAAIETIRIAAASRPQAGNPLVQLGLIGSTPEAILGSARSAFAEGDLGRVAQEADAAQSVWLSAEEVGRNRLLAAVGVALIGLMGLALLIGQVRERRRRRSNQLLHWMMAHRIGAAGSDGGPDRQSLD
jgi:hypothetical protein